MEKGLRRTLSPFHVWAIAFGCIIGWGSFVNPGKKFLPDSGVLGTGLAMILGAVVMIIISFSYAYMVPKYPESGGEFTFARKCFGKNAAFLCGWFLVIAYLANIPMNGTAIGLIVDGVDGTADILRFGFHYTVAGFDIYFGELLVSSMILLFIGFLNILGVRKAAFLQAVLAGILTFCVIVLCIAGIVYLMKHGIDPVCLWGFDRSAATAAGSTDYAMFSHTGVSGILGAVFATFAIAPWAYVGFDAIPQAAEEFNFSFRKVSGIMVTAILFGCFVYVSNNTVTGLVLRDWPERVMAGEWVVLVAAEMLLGQFGKILVAFGVSSAVLSGIMGFYLASSRLMYSMGKSGYLPKMFGKVNEKYGTPVNAILFCMLLSLSGPVLGRNALGWFVDMSAIGASVGYFFTSAATWVFVKQEQGSGGFLRIVSLLGMIFSVCFMILQLIPVPGLSGVHFGMESYILLIIWIVLGFCFRHKIRGQIGEIC